MRFQELWRGIKKEREKIEKKSKVEEPRFKTKQNSNLKSIFLILEERGARGLIEKDLLFLLEDRDWIRICLVKEKFSPLIIKEKSSIGT